MASISRSHRGSKQPKQQQSVKPRKRRRFPPLIGAQWASQPEPEHFGDGSYGWRIVEPSQPFDPQSPLERPKRFKEVRPAYHRGYCRAYAEYQVGIYNRRAKRFGWRTWAIVENDAKYAAVLYEVAQATAWMKQHGIDDLGLRAHEFCREITVRTHMTGTEITADGSGKSLPMRAIAALQAVLDQLREKVEAAEAGITVRCFRCSRFTIEQTL
jgi:hypothetical protein